LVNGRAAGAHFLKIFSHKLYTFLEIRFVL